MNALRTFFQYKKFSWCKQALVSLRIFTEIIFLCEFMQQENKNC
jgi:hypothetical protein